VPPVVAGGSSFRCARSDRGQRHCDLMVSNGGPPRTLGDMPLHAPLVLKPRSTDRAPGPPREPGPPHPGAAPPKGRNPTRRTSRMMMEVSPGRQWQRRTFQRCLAPLSTDADHSTQRCKKNPPQLKHQNGKARTSDKETKKATMDTPGGRTHDEDAADHAAVLAISHRQSPTRWRKWLCSPLA